MCCISFYRVKCIFLKCMYQVGVVYRQKKGGGEGEEARGFSTVRGAPQNGDGRVEADFAIMRLTAQPRHKICIFSNVAPKNVRKRGKCKRTKSDPKSPGEKHKKRPEVAWFTVTMRRATGRPDIDVARIQAADRTKTSTASKATLSICLMRMKMVVSSPICKSSVVDVVDLFMSRDHQNDNAFWLCRVTKKSEATKGPEQSAFKLTTIRSKISGLTTSAISKSTNARRKKSIESCR